MKNTTLISIRNPKRENLGFSLIEVLVSLVILAIGLLGLAMLQTTGMGFNTNSYSRTQATYLAYDLAERMRANVPAFQAGNYDVANTAAAATIKASANFTCNQTVTPSCTCDTGTCSNGTMANYDLGQWYYNLDRLLPGVKETATLATIVRAGNTATVTIFWLEHDRDPSGARASFPTSQTWKLEIY
jgi:type IV pilus assembly protein PilV